MHIKYYMVKMKLMSLSLSFVNAVMFKYWDRIMLACVQKEISS